MKLVMITRTMLAGGAEHMASNLLIHFDKAGVECVLIIYDTAATDYPIPEGVKVYSVGDNGDHPLKRYASIARILKEEKPDVALAMGEDVGTYTLGATLFSSLPLVVFEANDPAVLPKKKLTRFLRRVFYPTAAGFVFQSVGAANYFPKHIRKKGILLPNPLDCEKLPEPYTGVRDKTVVTAGRLEEQKNHRMLIRAFAKFRETHPDYTLTIWGEGRLRAELEQLASDLLPDGSWSMPGRTNTLDDDMNSAGMFAFPSDFEGVPNVLIEALAIGMPCVATDCPPHPGGNAQLITDGVNGLLTPVGDTEAFCEAMCRVADDEELARSLGSHYQMMRDIHDSRVISERWLEFVRSRARKVR